MHLGKQASADYSSFLIYGNIYRDKYREISFTAYHDIDNNNNMAVFHAEGVLDWVLGDTTVLVVVPIRLHPGGKRQKQISKSPRTRGPNMPYHTIRVLQ